jgi:hypothetical protein
MTMTAIQKQAKEIILKECGASTCSMRNGVLIARKSFFYTHGFSGEQFAKRISNSLFEHGIRSNIVNSSTVWKPFRGGDSVAQGSHFRADIEIVE